MNSLRVASIGFLVLASAASSYSWSTHGHMGGGPPSGRSIGNSRMTEHSAPPAGGQTQSQGQTPKQPSNSTQSQTPKQLSNPNSKLSSNLQKLLPAGTTPQQACSGFKELGQCVAAIHVSQNLGIPFADLKSKMTGSNSESLGKAIQDLKPGANAKTETKKANQEANDDIKESES